MISAWRVRDAVKPYPSSCVEVDVFFSANLQKAAPIGNASACKGQESLGLFGKALRL